MLNFLHNFPYYLGVKEDGHTIEYAVSFMLEEESIEKLTNRVHHVLRLLNSISSALNRFQSNEIKLAECVDIWLDLLTGADEDSARIIKARIVQNNAFSDVALGLM